MSKTKALSAVTIEETHRFVGGADTKVGFVSAIVPVSVGVLWQPVACHDINGKALQGMRTWGLPPVR